MVQTSLLASDEITVPNKKLDVHRQRTGYSYKKIGVSKGNARIWFQSQKLSDYGFDVKTPFYVDYDQELKVIVLSRVQNPDHNSRLVSSRTRNNRTTPIIDLNSQVETALFDGAQRVKVAFEVNRITITLHPEDQAQQEREASFRANLAAGGLTSGTFCAGGGISTAAVHDSLLRLGIKSEVKFIIDREAKYIESAVLRNYAITPQTRIIEGSLEEIEPSDIQQVNELQVSLPCTGHSKSGKSKNHIQSAEEHTDATAVIGFFPLLRAANPALLLSENVPEAQHSESYMLVRAELTRLGYHLFEFILDGTDAGTLEQRKRYWLMAVSSGLIEQQDLKLDKIVPIHQTCADIKDDIAEDDSMWAANEYLSLKAERDSAAGKGFKRQFIYDETTVIGTIGKDYAKRRSTEPFWKRADGMERLMTPREHARGKRVPYRLVEGESFTVAHQILGQSILYSHPYLLLSAFIKKFKGVDFFNHYKEPTRLGYAKNDALACPQVEAMTAESLNLN